jgi:hypothetical protein
MPSFRVSYQGRKETVEVVAPAIGDDLAKQVRAHLAMEEDSPVSIFECLLAGDQAAANGDVLLGTRLRGPFNAAKELAWDAFKIATGLRRDLANEAAPPKIEPEV